MTDTIVIIGASHAGVQMAASAREAGWTGRIVLVGEETTLPYQKPPLSKGLLLGKSQLTDIALRAPAWYEGNSIERLTGVRAIKIQRCRRSVLLDNQLELPYTRLGLATGASVRRLPSPKAGLADIHYLRTLNEAKSLRAKLLGAESVAVIGGGFVGLEVAASAITFGCNVTIIEGQDRLMARAVTKHTSEWFAKLHANHGVDIRLGKTVAEIDKDGVGLFNRIRLSNGDEIRADLTVIGIGMVPNHGLAEEAGLVCSNGIVVNDSCATSDPNIFAAGDVALHPSIFAGRHIRLESVQNAVDQGKVAGKHLAGAFSETYQTVPWFWSEQYSKKLQIVGLPDGIEASVVRGDPSSGRFSVFSFQDGRIVCIESVDNPKEHILGRKLLSSKFPHPTIEQVADPEFNLSSLFVQ